MSIGSQSLGGVSPSDIRRRLFSSLRPGPAGASAGARVAHLDGWRGIAVALVWIGHFTPVPGVDLGTLGVQLFFVLSGRLMAQILFVEKFPLGKFYVRRLSRVWPTLFVFATCAFVIFQLADYNHVSLFNYLAAISFTYNYATLFHEAGVLNHLWSLAVEEHTYLALGALAFMSRRYGLPPLPVMLAAACFCVVNGAVQTWAFEGDLTHVYWRTDVAMGSILMGAVGWLWWKESPRPIPAWLPVASLALGMLMNASALANPTRYGLGTVFLAFAITTLDIAPRWFLRLLCLPLLVQIGLWSYSLYVWQQPFYVLSMDKLPLPLMLAGALVASLLSFYFVEQPARRYLNARFAGPRTPSVEPVPL